MVREETQQNGSVSRRNVLKKTALAAGGAVVGTSVFAGQAAADTRDCSGCLEVCWLDVKPSSCPNSVNPNSSGVLPVAAGWPNFDVSTVELIPVKGRYDAAFGDCQDFEDVQYSKDAATATELCERATTSDRSATPIRSRVELVNDNGVPDSKFKFRVSDLQLESDDTSLILRGESTDGDCTYLAIDSVRVLGGTEHGTGNGTGNGTRNGNPGGRGETNEGNADSRGRKNRGHAGTRGRRDKANARGRGRKTRHS